jgi:hypothetical protein
LNKCHDATDDDDGILNECAPGAELIGPVEANSDKNGAAVLSSLRQDMGWETIFYWENDWLSDAVRMDNGGNSNVMRKSSVLNTTTVHKCHTPIGT